MMIYVVVNSASSKKKLATQQMKASYFANSPIVKSDILSHEFFHQGQFISTDLIKAKQKLVRGLKLTGRHPAPNVHEFVLADSVYLLCYKLPIQDLTPPQIANFYFQNQDTFHEYLQYILDANFNQKNAEDLQNSFSFEKSNDSASLPPNHNSDQTFFPEPQEKDKLEKNNAEKSKNKVVRFST